MGIPKAGLLAALAKVPDFRQDSGRRFELYSILAAVVCGVLSGQTGVKQIVQWLHAQPAGFWHLLGFTRTPPGETWVRKVLAKVDPEAFRAVVLEWLGGDDQSGLKVVHESSVATVTAGTTTGSSSAANVALEAFSIDGKTLRGTVNRLAKALHVLTAWAHHQRLVFEQQPVGNTNEPTAAIKMFRDMLLTNKLVVGDAIFCQRELCQTLIDQQGHYLVWVKENQPQLLKDARSVFVDPAGCSPLRQATA